MKIIKVMKPLNVIAVVLIALTAILTLLKVGPTTNPMFTYLPSSEDSQFVGIFLLVLSILLATYLIFSILTNRFKSYYGIGINVLLISLVSDLLFGGNVSFMIASLFGVVVLILNINVFKKGTK